MRFVILDFYRTLYNPETRKLVSGAKETLQELRKRGFCLILISRHERGRGTEIFNCGIAPLLSEILLVRGKKATVLKRLLKSHQVNPKTILIVGDRIREEIAAGNSLGCKTIWLRQGKFANEKPRNKSETPNVTIRKLKQLLDVTR